MNTIKTIQTSTSRNSENLILETSCAILKGFHKCSLVTVSETWTCSAQTAAGDTAWPRLPWYGSIQQVLHPTHMPHTLPSSPIPSCYFSLILCSLLLPSPQFTKDRSSQNRMHTGLTSFMVPKGHGLSVQGQENGNTCQMYKWKISIQIV